MSEDFCTGLLVGFLAAGVMGFLLQQFYLSYKKMTEATRPQVIVATTKKTPAQVVTSSIQAGCLLVVTILFVGLMLWLLLDGL